MNPRKQQRANGIQFGFRNLLFCPVIIFDRADDELDFIRVFKVLKIFPPVARLLAASIGPARVRYDGRGDSEPLTPNDTPQGRAKNRRVEITLHVPAGEAAAAGSPAAPRKP